MNNQNITVNPDELKNAANVIKQCLIDLKKAKSEADIAWENCNMSMGENIISKMNENKEYNDKKFEDAIAKLETKAISLDSISNIWKDSEIEIMSSYKQFDELFATVNKASETIKNLTGNNKQQ